MAAAARRGRPPRSAQAGPVAHHGLRLPDLVAGIPVSRETFSPLQKGNLALGFDGRSTYMCFKGHKHGSDLFIHSTNLSSAYCMPGELEA